MGKRLRNSPLLESVCEFRFDPSSDWDMTIPGRVFERIKDKFPERSPFKTYGVKLNPQQIPIATIKEEEIIRFKQPDGAAMVQVGRNLLAINRLQYSKWEDFRGLIIYVFENYKQFVGDSKISRIGLRYINRIALKNPQIDIGNIISLRPSLKGELDKPLKGFYQRYEIEEDDPEGVLIHQTGLQRSGDEFAVMLDLDFGTTKTNESDDMHNIKLWLDSAHNRIYEAFIDSLNESYYEKIK